MTSTTHSPTHQLPQEQLSLYLSFIDEHERFASLTSSQKRQILEDILCRNYMDLLSDWAFKHVFGHDKDALIMLLRDLLPLDIVDLEYVSNEVDRLRPDDKAATMDVVCRLASGEEVIVEMQREYRDDFYDRMFYYGAAGVISQVRSGRRYNDIQAVYLICFMDFVLKHTVCPKDKLIFIYDFLEQETGEPYGEHPYFSVRLCELPRLDKSEMREMSPVEHWFHLLKNLRTFALNPKGVPSRYDRILKAARLAGITEEERQQYLKNMLTEYDERMISRGNYKRGFADGLEKGEKKNALEIARRMLAKGYPVADVAEMTELTEEQVRALMR